MENYVENLVRKVMWKVLLTKCVQRVWQKSGKSGLTNCAIKVVCKTKVYQFVEKLGAKLC